MMKQEDTFLGEIQEVCCMLYFVGILFASTKV